MFTRRSVLVRAFLAACAASTGPSVHAQTASVIEVRGQARIERGSLVLPVATVTEVLPSDVLVTEPDSEILLRLADGARMALRPDSRLNIEDLPAARRQTRMELLNGGLRYLSGRKTRKDLVSFRTHTATIGIRGTDIEIALAQPGAAVEPGTYLKVNAGAAVLSATDGARVELVAGEVAVGAAPDLTPRAPGVVRRPAARRVADVPPDLFRPGALDARLR